MVYQVSSSEQERGRGGRRGAGVVCEEVQREERHGGREATGRGGRFTSCTVDGNVSWCSHYGKQCGGSSKGEK